MRKKVRRIVLLVPLLAGSQVAYPQNSFPGNLHNSSLYWGHLMSFPETSQPDELAKQWNQISHHALLKAEIVALENVLNLTHHMISQLKKEEKQFLLRYQYLAIYLSAMNPASTGLFDRSGIWMLSYPDATRYGLAVNQWVDERRDIEKSTQAARLLFKDLRKRHGANAEAMFVLGVAGWKKTSKDITNVIGENLTALRLVSKNFRGGQFHPTPSGWVAQEFDGQVNIDVLTLAHGLDNLQFQQMNPTLIGGIIPKGTIVRLPKIIDGHRIVADSKLEESVKTKRLDSMVNRIKNDIPSPSTHKVITHKVKPGDVLGRIAEHYGVRVSKIKKWNNLRSDRIDINQKLTIYYSNGRKIPSKTIAQKTPKPEVKLLAKEVGKFTIYEVQHGDTLWGISKKYTGVKPEDIMGWNAIGEDLSIGQKLKIKTLN